MYVPVNELHGEVEGGRHELKFHVHLDDPVDEDRTHARVDLLLGGHVRAGGPLCLCVCVCVWVGGCVRVKENEEI